MSNQKVIRRIPTMLRKGPPVPRIEAPKRYQCIMADPNWMYDNFGAKKHGAVRAHYKCSPVKDICKIPVGEKFAAKDCILLLWATWPKLSEAMQVIDAWGFHLVTGLPWVKTTPSTGNIRRGIGFWFQSASEMLLVCRKGKAKGPLRKDPQIGLLCGSDGAFYSPRSKHSVKPLTLQDYALHRLKGPHLELFARANVQGWDCWGHDTGMHLCEEGAIPLEEARNRGLVEQLH